MENRSKKIITFGVLFSLIVLGGKYSADRYVQYRISRYQSCDKQKAEIIKKHNIYKVAKAREEEYWEQKSETFQTTKSEKTSGLLGGYIVSNNPAELVVFDNNNDHPCVWLESHAEFRNRRAASSGNY